jgi:hypothetical protein
MSPTGHPCPRPLPTAITLITVIIVLLGLLALESPDVGAAQSPPPRKPFVLPFAVPAGPSTWMFEQYYGNTPDAYNFGKYWYRAGQGLHFGLDFEAPCGLSVTAIGDGVVEQIDNGLFGAGPHNLVIRHEAVGVVSVYGHLRERPRLLLGQPVQRGMLVGTVGDPDLSCRSRPHLHLEIRSLDYRLAYNPVQFIDADWDMLYSLQAPEVNGFAKDIRRPALWQSDATQPTLRFNDAILNTFSQTWPPAYRLQAPPLTLPAYRLPPLSGAPATLTRLTRAGCCTQPWWSPGGSAVHYLDRYPDQDLAHEIQVALDAPQPQVIGPAPPRTVSPDGRYEVRSIQGELRLASASPAPASPEPPSAEPWRGLPLFTRGAYPCFSPGSTRLLWHVRPADEIPGEIRPRGEIWVAEVATGEGRLVRVQSGGSVRWLDEDRLLLIETPDVAQVVRLSILTLSTGEVRPLITGSFMRALSVAPGGQHLMYALIFQDDPTQNGVHLLETRPGARPQRVPFFGGWRWRDSHSVVYIPFGQPRLSLMVYDIRTQRQRRVSLPDGIEIRIASADWVIAPDGRHLTFVESSDQAIWVLSLPTLARF